MSELHPDLKRLLRQASQARTGDDQAPFGFTTRVLARCGAETAESNKAFQALFRLVAALSCLMIVCSGFVLLRQRLEPKPVKDFASATQFFAKNILP
jgi:hypothetical protein